MDRTIIKILKTDFKLKNLGRNAAKKCPSNTFTCLYYSLKLYHSKFDML